MKKKFYFLSFSFAFTLSNTYALINFEDAIFPELITSGRALAMGNAFVSRSDDADAVFYNPAGLGTIRFGRLHLNNFSMEFNKDWFDLAAEGKFNDLAKKFKRGFGINGQRKLLRDSVQKGVMNSRFQAMPNFTTRYFSLGYMFSRYIKAGLGTKKNDLFEYASRLDHGPYAALNFSFFGGVFKIGGSATYLKRKEVFGEIDPNINIDDDKLPYSKGTMTYVIGGAKLTLPIAWLPTFSGVVHNSSNKPFENNDSDQVVPGQIKQTVVVGFSLTPQVGRYTRLHWEINYKDLNRAFRNVEDTRRWTGGFEFDIKRRVFIRFGYGDGYGSFGFGVKSRKLKFDLTTYAVDTTSKSWRGREDRRVIFNISSGI